MFYIHFSFIYIKWGSSLLSPLNDTSVNILDVEGSFQFSLEAEFSQPLYVQIALATYTSIPTFRNQTRVKCELILGPPKEVQG